LALIFQPQKFNGTTQVQPLKLQQMAKHKSVYYYYYYYYAAFWSVLGTNRAFAAELGQKKLY